jgi:hypothetical protein
MSCLDWVAIYLGLWVFYFLHCLFRWWLPYRCPHCRVRGLVWLTTCRYRTGSSKRDVWGKRSGSYQVWSCPRCGLHRLYHETVWEDLPGLDWEKEARAFVFGERKTEVDSGASRHQP